MRGVLTKSAAALLLAATNLAMIAPARAAEVSVRTLAAQEARLATMAYAMATASSSVCSHPEMMTGMILHDLTQYRPDRRSEVSRAFGLQAGFGVLQLVPGSAAVRAGLRIDDEIVEVGGVAVTDAAAAQSAPKSFRRMQGFTDILEARLSRGPTPLLIRRGGQLRTLVLSAERGCGGQLSLATSPGLNAWSDGRHIVLTTGMDAFAHGNDEIAFVIAHEMAHNILGHFSHSGAMGIFGAPRARNDELDADGFAVRLMSAAGYRPAGGISFLERSRRRLWWAFSLDHPGFGSRIRTVATEIGKWQQVQLANARSPATVVTAPAPVVVADRTAVKPTPIVIAANFARPAPVLQVAAWRPALRMWQP